MPSSHAAAITQIPRWRHNGRMATIKDALRDDLGTALKSGDTNTVSTIRMALTAISKAEVSGKQAHRLTDDEVISVLNGELKRRREAAAAFQDADRPERAAQELAEADVLARYLPAPLTEKKVQDLVAAAVAGAAEQGLSGGRAMGAVMKELKPATNGRFDGGRLAAMVKAALGM